MGRLAQDAIGDVDELLGTLAADVVAAADGMVGQALGMIGVQAVVKDDDFEQAFREGRFHVAEKLRAQWFTIRG